MSAIVGTEQYIKFFHNPHGIIQGAIGSALAAGSVVGSLLAGPLSNKIGRRDAVFVACLWWILGVRFLSFYHTINHLVFAILTWKSLDHSTSILPQFWPAHCRPCSQWCLRWNHLFSSARLPSRNCKER